MATTMKPRDARRERSFDPVGPPEPPPVDTGPWEDYAPEAAAPAAGAPAVAAMPPRAAKLPTQNGQAMRTVFAYLLDEDDPPPPPPARGRRR
jgi:hypothetical protein